MKVFMRKDVELVGATGEIVTVGDGYARNFLLPKGLAVEVTAENESSFLKRIKVIENRKEVIVAQTSMLAEKIKAIKLTIKRKMHDDGKLYAALNPQEIVQLLAERGVSVSKNQIKIAKSIKNKGTYAVVVQLTSRLKPEIVVEVTAE